MPVHTVKQGDCLASIAKQYGFKSWRTIYDDGLNSAFKKRRQNPNIISAGDQIFISPKSAKTVSRPTGERHTFVLTSDSCGVSSLGGAWGGGEGRSARFRPHAEERQAR